MLNILDKSTKFDDDSINSKILVICTLSSQKQLHSNNTFYAKFFNILSTSVVKVYFSFQPQSCRA